MKPYMVLDRMTGAQMQVNARNPYVARELALKSWETARIGHGPENLVEVYEKLDPAAEAQHDALARSSLQWLSEDALLLGG